MNDVDGAVIDIQLEIDVVYVRIYIVMDVLPFKNVWKNNTQLVFVVLVRFGDKV